MRRSSGTSERTVPRVGFSCGEPSTRGLRPHQYDCGGDGEDVPLEHQPRRGQVARRGTCDEVVDGRPHGSRVLEQGSSSLSRPAHSGTVVYSGNEPLTAFCHRTMVIQGFSGGRLEQSAVSESPGFAAKHGRRRQQGLSVVSPKRRDDSVLVLLIGRRAQLSDRVRVLFADATFAAPRPRNRRSEIWRRLS